MNADTIVTVVSVPSVLDYVEIGCLLLTFLVAVVSAIYAVKSYKKQQNRARKEMACNLAQIYAETILPDYQFIYTVLDTSGIAKEAKELFPMEEFKVFDENELNCFIEYKERTRKEVDEIYSNVNGEHVFALLLCRDPSLSKIEELSNMILGTEPHSHTLKKYWEMNFSLEIPSLLNRFEWFTMSLRYGIADEEILFQSLHQTFLSAVWLLYYYIARSNKNAPGDKYYTNIIWLFDRWHSRLKGLKADVPQFFY